MAVVGTFKKTGANEYTGTIRTLSLQVKNVRIIPAEASSSETAPSHRVELAGIDLGAAWTKATKEDNREYLGVKLDDPTFAAPIFANLVADDDKGVNYSLMWSRPHNRNK